MTTVLVTGGAGQLGRALADASWSPGTTVIVADRTMLDVTDPEAVWASVRELHPDVVVNAAAYTAVDRAEDQPAAAQAVNTTAVSHLAEVVASTGGRLVHISTDFVFDGDRGGGAYVEVDRTAPLNVYGSTKLAGERAALVTGAAVVLRTSWLYDATGPNFVTRVLHRALAGATVPVVDDRYGCPTAAPELARAITRLVAEHRDLAGLFHLTAPEGTSWYGLARAAQHLWEGRGAGRVEPVPSSTYLTRAPRPADTRLSSRALAGATGIELPPWEESLAEVLRRVKVPA